MLIHDILKLRDEDIYFVEESFASLKRNALTLRYLEGIREHNQEVNGILDENGEIIGLTLFDEEENFWVVFTNLVSSIPYPNESSIRFSKIAKQLKLNSIYKTSRREFNTAIIEYYSLALVNRQLCNDCSFKKEPYEMVYIEDRNTRLKELLSRYKLYGNILEIGCGNGMSTLPMHELGYDPLAIDIDKCMICQGLEHNVLDPKRTIVLDAKQLSAFFPENSFDVIAGFMMGSIYPFNKEVWVGIVQESIKVLKHKGMIMLTTNKKQEIEILKNALEKSVSGEIIDNTDEKGIYDQWVYVGYKN